MELKAVINGLKMLKISCKVIVHTDSQYIKQGITEWINKWKTNGWKTADKKPVKNRELWQELDEVACSMILIGSGLELTTVICTMRRQIDLLERNLKI